MKRTVNFTSGVVLDPFSIHATGILRAHTASKLVTGVPGSPSDMFSILHGEERFKRAFVNCCHFAESMTVVGPVTQLYWEAGESSAIAPSLRWLAMNEAGDNAEYFENIRAFCAAHMWDSVPAGSVVDGTTGHLLNILPDTTFKLPAHKTDTDWMAGAGESDENRKAIGRLFNHLYKSPSTKGILNREVKELRPGVPFEATFPNVPGSPVLALMAVTFSFKKPGGWHFSSELTNLAGWPPVTFLLPVLVPACSTIRRHTENLYCGSALDTVVNQQPAIYSYRLTLKTGRTILPFGQPFNLTSISGHGKAPDTLRSLSDVFKAMWSQATQYSAWNVDFTCNTDDEEQAVHGYMNPLHDVNFALEPIGAGRRIRGHNRYMGQYQFDNLAMIWEDSWDKGSGGADVFGLDLDLAKKDCTKYQLRQRHRSGRNPYENIFIMPSYFGEATTEALFPTALTLMRYNIVDEATIADFMAGRFFPSVEPVDVRKSDSTHGPRRESFGDRIHNHFSTDHKNRGAIPVHRTKADIAFDKAGDPTVFGLSADTDMFHLLNKQDHSPEEIERLATGIKTLGSFKFLDAICSTSTKDLTDVFGPIKKSGVTAEAGTKAADMLDKELAIDLFGDGLDEMF
jgi:hypothetical protein